MMPVRYGAAGRRKILGTCIAQVSFRGPQAVPVGRGFGAAALHRYEFLADISGPGLGQQLLDDLFRLLVSSLAELVMADLPLCIDQVEGRPDPPSAGGAGNVLRWVD